MRKVGTIANLFIALFFLNMIIAAYKLMSGATVDSGARITGNIVVAVVSAICFLIINKYKFSMVHIDILMIISVLFMAFILMGHLVSNDFRELVPYIFNFPERISSILIPIAIFDIYLYFTCTDSMKRIFYCSVAIIDFVCMALNNHIVGEWILVLAFMLYLILMRPVANNIKQIMILFAVYMIILSNMCLITNYTSVVVTGLQLDLEHCVYLDLVFAVFGLIFFTFWDRIPEGVDLDRLVLKRLGRVLQLIFAGFLGFLFLLVSGADHIGEIKEGIFSNIIRSFGIPLVNSIKSTRNVLITLTNECGIVTLFLVLFLTISLLYIARRHLSFNKPITSMWFVQAVAFGVSLLFWTPEVVGIILGAISMLMAAFYIEERQHNTTFGIKF